MIRIGDINNGDTITAQFNTEPAGTFTITGAVRKKPHHSSGSAEGYVLWVGGRTLEGSSGFVKILEHTPALPPEPELYTVHADADGDAWIRLGDGWHLMDGSRVLREMHPWGHVFTVHGPLAPLTRAV